MAIEIGKETILRVPKDKDLKELEKFGFIKKDGHYEYTYIRESDCVPREQSICLCIWDEQKRYEFLTDISFGQYSELFVKMFDLTQAGLVEKVEVEYE